MKPGLSIIFPRHNEPLSFILDAISSIKESIDVEAEIIIVDDGSVEPLPDIEGIIVLHHEENLGVGAAFRTGAKVAKSDNLFIMGNDIRFLPNKWASMMVKAVEANPKSMICTKCIGLNDIKPENMDLAHRMEVAPHRNGATILFYHDHLSHPKKPENFKNVLEAQWLPIKTQEGLVEIPAVLGAAYGIRKEWFEYTNMFYGHKRWGTLEPLCSLQSWLCGGNCLCHHGIATGHIFKKVSPHGTPPSHLVYNKLLLANLLLPDELRDKMISFLGINMNVLKAKLLFDTEKIAIFAEREVYKKKITYDVYDYCKRFNIDLRND